MMSGATDQYSDAGQASCSASGEEIGHEVSYLRHEQEALQGKREARVRLDIAVCVCVCCGISCPCRPRTAWWSCMGGNAVEAGGCQKHILPAG